MEAYINMVHIHCIEEGHNDYIRKTQDITYTNYAELDYISYRKGELTYRYKGNRNFVTMKNFDAYDTINIFLSKSEKMENSINEVYGPELEIFYDGAKYPIGSYITHRNMSYIQFDNEDKVLKICEGAAEGDMSRQFKYVLTDDVGFKLRCKIAYNYNHDYLTCNNHKNILL